MAHFFSEASRTFSEYLLLPNLTTKDCIPENVILRTPLVKFKVGHQPPSLEVNIPFASAIMQAVSDHNLAIALARQGGVSFIYGSQSIEEQAAMVRTVKSHKAGFVVSDSNLKCDSTIADVVELTEETGHSTIPITEDGSSSGELFGLITDKDYRLSRVDLNAKVSEFMTPFPELIVGQKGTTIEAANDLIWKHKINCLPIVDENRRLIHLVFRKDYDDHKKNPLESVDSQKRLVVGAGINTRDYKERVPALVAAGVDVICVDSSEGYTEWQSDTIQFIKDKYGDTVKVGAGNVVHGDAFMYLVEAGADFIKVGIGGGAICITREQKGIGRGQATAVIEVARQRDLYLKETGV
ncbi:IMP dehydrogenase, partial [Candidatus Poribacteria bacterium]|nr:IMP dehydrogenase [Candidatus Poribacteria bacterium]